MRRSTVRGGRRASSREFYGASVSMASSGNTSSRTRQRIRANVQGRKKGDPPEKPSEQEAADAVRAEAAERILSHPIKSKTVTKRRKKRRGRSLFQVGLLGTIVIGGIAAIIGLRYLAEMFAAN